MTDKMTLQQRSYTMSRIRSKWTSQEVLVHKILECMRIKHRMHPKMEGNPDLILPERKVAVFLHGCFWHKCPFHYRPPKSNKSYWLPKIRKNAVRDKENIRLLKNAGWKVVVIWEHDMKRLNACIRKFFKIT